MVGGFVGWGVITGLLAGPGARLPGLVVVLLALVCRHGRVRGARLRDRADRLPTVAERAGHGRHHQRPRRVHRAPDRRDPGLRSPVQAHPDQPGPAERLGGHDRRHHDPVRPAGHRGGVDPPAAGSRVRGAADAMGPGDAGDGAGPRGGRVHGRRRRPRRVARLRDGLGAGRGRGRPGRPALHPGRLRVRVLHRDQGLHRGRHRRDRLHPGRFPGRPRAGRGREPRHGIHLAHLQGCDHVRAAGRGPAPAPDRAPRTAAANPRGGCHVLGAVPARLARALARPRGRHPPRPGLGRPGRFEDLERPRPRPRPAGPGPRGAPVSPARRRRHRARRRAHREPERGRRLDRTPVPGPRGLLRDRRLRLRLPRVAPLRRAPSLPRRRRRGRPRDRRGRAAWSAR